ncbi:hypothetical protein HanIR_Chr10g0453631 [Helianthus annuus]|nr:hypothetical protein HanIR_Chr10g0453631 [Helianthus annuus]
MCFGAVPDLSHVCWVGLSGNSYFSGENGGGSLCFWSCFLVRRLYMFIQRPCSSGIERNGVERGSDDSVRLLWLWLMLMFVEDDTNSS